MATTNFVDQSTFIVADWLNDVDAVVYEGVFPATITSVTVDTVNEKTAANGVTVDGVLLKDSQVSTDTINEKTSAAGVTIDGVLLKDNQVTTDVINEKTGAAGVTIDSVLLKDNTVTATTLTANTSVVTDTISEKTAATGVTIDGVLLKDGGITITTDLSVAQGGTGASTAADARVNLGVLWEKLLSTPANNSPSIDFNSTYVLNDSYTQFKIVGSRITPATDGAQLYMRFGSTNSADTGNNYFWMKHSFNTGGTEANTGGASQAQIVLSLTLENSQSHDFELTINTAATQARGFGFITAQSSVSSLWNQEQTHFAWTNAVKLNFITLYMSSGNITSGTFTLYGLK